MNCRHCSKPLNRQQFRADEKWKSCPKCSKEHGTEHVYYEYPDAFGTTEKRASAAHPEGPQSYCTACRTDGDPPQRRLTCAQLSEGGSA